MTTKIKFNKMILCLLICNAMAYGADASSGSKDCDSPRSRSKLKECAAKISADKSGDFVAGVLGVCDGTEGTIRKSLMTKLLNMHVDKCYNILKFAQQFDLSKMDGDDKLNVINLLAATRRKHRNMLVLQLVKIFNTESVRNGRYTHTQALEWVK